MKMITVVVMADNLIVVVLMFNCLMIVIVISMKGYLHLLFLHLQVWVCQLFVNLCLIVLLLCQANVHYDCCKKLYMCLRHRHGLFDLICGYKFLHC